jgi:hypothetical protein
MKLTREERIVLTDMLFAKKNWLRERISNVESDKRKNVSTKSFEVNELRKEISLTIGLLLKFEAIDAEDAKRMRSF